ncbi:MAG TPA: hypothetical protein VFV78_03420 [Vicinamibacterales bacterium]|nr:hypothetical protein [Vicinamibacterales bacterium]
MSRHRLTAGPALLVVGHPGHELMVHGWMEAARPMVMVLTDGSGQTGVSRLPSTAALIARAGATAGPIFGRFSDAEIYRTLLERRTPVFADLVDELADVIVDHHIGVVAGDDAEGFNPTHDVCRLIIDAAVRLAGGRASRPVLNAAFALMDAPGAARRATTRRQTTFTLEPAALDRKMAAALSYAEMAAEVSSARARWGDESFGIETFRHVRDGEVWRPADGPPYYERHGRKRVDEGAYQEMICYDQHIRPLANVLRARSLREAS